MGHSDTDLMASSGARTSSMGCWGAERRESRSLTAPLWNKTTGSPPGTQWTLQTSDDTWREYIQHFTSVTLHSVENPQIKGLSVGNKYCSLCVCDPLQCWTTYFGKRWMCPKYRDHSHQIKMRTLLEIGNCCAKMFWSKNLKSKKEKIPMWPFGDLVVKWRLFLPYWLEQK